MVHILYKEVKNNPPYRKSMPAALCCLEKASFGRNKILYAVMLFQGLRIYRGFGVCSRSSCSDPQNEITQAQPIELSSLVFG